MICQRCGLTAPYRGPGDGIGSCECPRCQCCQAAPDECDCGKDTEYLDQEELDELGDDFSCNDPACLRRIYRQERARAAVEGGA